MPVQLVVVPLAADRAVPGTDVVAGLKRSLAGAGMGLEDGDVLVISTKYVSCAQGRVIDMGRVRQTGAGSSISGRYGLDPGMAEVIARESDRILGGTGGFVLAYAGGVLAPNAGIDRSNSGEGMAVLYPEDPYRAAEEIRRSIFLEMGAKIGVILADSRLMPARVGTTGVAVACAGIEPVRDARAEPDLDGRPLKVTFQATADGLASAANHGMGEAAESAPFVVLRGSGAALTGRRIDPSEASVHVDQCVYVRGLRGA